MCLDSKERLGVNPELALTYAKGLCILPRSPRSAKVSGL